MYVSKNNKINNNVEYTFRTFQEFYLLFANLVFLTLLTLIMPNAQNGTSAQLKATRKPQE